MKVLVTGANSLLGTNILIELLNREYEVKAMVRSPNKLSFSPPNLEICIGDITDKKAVLEAVNGCEIIIHVAADTSQSSLDYTGYQKVNVGGTKNVLSAANEKKVKRVIFVSSANAFAFGTPKNPGTEEKEISYPFSRAGYARSKFEAQQYVLNHLKEDSPEVIIVNPTFMLGGYDSKPSSGEIILRGYHKRYIFAPPGGKNFVHVKDAADAICNAIRMGKSGECYLLSNENLSYKAFYKKMMEVTNQKSKILVLPKFILLLVGLLGSLLARIGIPTSAHYINMRILCVENYYSNKKAQTELKLKNTSIKIAISDAIDFFVKKRMVEK